MGKYSKDAYNNPLALALSFARKNRYAFQIKNDPATPRARQLAQDKSPRNPGNALTGISARV